MGVKSVGIIAGQNIPTIISPQNYKIRSLKRENSGMEWLSA
jgi:hypothetical protein